jgi:hypothetical protein
MNGVSAPEETLTTILTFFLWRCWQGFQQHVLGSLVLTVCPTVRSKMTTLPFLFLARSACLCLGRQHC